MSADSSQNDKYFFSNQPNLNRILLTKMENIKDRDLIEEERELLKQQISGSKLKVFLWPDKPKDIPDTEELKLIIASERSQDFMDGMLEFKGETPRVHRNTIFFLCPSDTEKNAFSEQLKRRIAYEQIIIDRTLNLTGEQRKEVENHLKREEENLRDAIRRLYRLLYVPTRDGVRAIDIGIPTYGEKKGLDQEVYEKLRMENEVLEKIAPLVIKERYLREKDYVKMSQIYDSMMKTPGERRTVGRSVLEEGVRHGVKLGTFGLGELVDGTPSCRFFKEDASVSFSDNEVLVSDTLCISQRQAPGVETTVIPVGPFEAGTGQAQWTKPPEISEKVMNELTIRFGVPRGKVSQIMGIMNYLQSRFKSLDLELTARDGSLSEKEYSEKIKEALRQLGVTFG